jgi:hypothetical protein
MPLDLTDLQPGDILFENNGLDLVHALIYVGPQEDNENLVVAHAIYDANRDAAMNVVGLSRLPEANYVVVRCKDPELAKKAVAQALKWAQVEVPYDVKRKDIIFSKKDEAFVVENCINILERGTVTYFNAASQFVNKAAERQWDTGKSFGQDAGYVYMIRRAHDDVNMPVPERNSTGILRVLKFATREDFPTFPMPPKEERIDKNGRATQRGFNCSFFAALCDLAPQFRTPH